MEYEVLKKKIEELYGEIEVKIEGITPLLMHRLVHEELDKRGRTTRKVPTNEEYAEAHKYSTVVDGEEVLCIWANHLYSMILEAAKGMKIGRSPAWKAIAGTIEVKPDEIPLKRNGRLIKGDEYEIDVRSVIVDGKRILRARAKVNIPWEAEFKILYDRELHDEKSLAILREILEQGGRRVGILDYRPLHKGSFGKFIVTKFEVVS